MVRLAFRRENLDETLVRPTYQNRLRAIGSHLDKEQYRDATVIEAKGGFIVRATIADDPLPQVVEFPNSEVEGLAHEAFGRRGEYQNYKPHSSIVPTGYQDLFRALGHLMDNRSAVGITILELESHVLIAGRELARFVAGKQTYRQFEHFLSAEDVQTLLDDAFRQRTRS